MKPKWRRPGYTTQSIKGRSSSNVEMVSKMLSDAAGNDILPVTFKFMYRACRRYVVTPYGKSNRSVTVQDNSKFNNSVLHNEIHIALALYIGRIVTVLVFYCNCYSNVMT